MRGGLASPTLNAVLRETPTDSSRAIALLARVAHDDTPEIEDDAGNAEKPGERQLISTQTNGCPGLFLHFGKAKAETAVTETGTVHTTVNGKAAATGTCEDIALELNSS